MISTLYRRQLSRAFMASAVLFSATVPCEALPENQTTPAVPMDMRDLGKQLQVGDVVFIRIPSQPFTKVASTTASWTNHVGIVSDVSGEEPVISESRVPFSGDTNWSHFVKRSDMGRVAVSRLPVPLDQQQQSKLKQAVVARRGILYDAGFDLHSRRQFCSRYVREVLQEAARCGAG